jgi:hypothetical protein
MRSGLEVPNETHDKAKVNEPGPGEGGRLRAVGFVHGGLPAARCGLAFFEPKPLRDSATFGKRVLGKRAFGKRAFGRRAFGKRSGTAEPFRFDRLILACRCHKAPLRRLVGRKQRSLGRYALGLAGAPHSGRL